MDTGNYIPPVNIVAATLPGKSSSVVFAVRIFSWPLNLSLFKFWFILYNKKYNIHKALKKRNQFMAKGPSDIGEKKYGIKTGKYGVKSEKRIELNQKTVETSQEP